MLNENQIMIFLKEDKNYEPPNAPSLMFHNSVCKLCGCLIENMRADSHRIKCHPTKLTIKDIKPQEGNQF